MEQETIAFIGEDRARCLRCNEFKDLSNFAYLDLVRLCRECLPPAFIGYIAGFFDGEGHVELRPNTNDPHHINFDQADLEPLYAIEKRFPGGLLNHEYNVTKGMWHLKYNGWRAVPLCTIMMPHLIVKRSEVNAYLMIMHEEKVGRLNRRSSRQHRHTPDTPRWTKPDPGPSPEVLAERAERREAIASAPSPFTRDFTRDPIDKIPSRESLELIASVDATFPLDEHLRHWGYE